MILTSFRIGIRRAIENWKMVALLVMVSILIAAPVALPVFNVILLTATRRPAADRLLSDNIDVVWLIDLVNKQFPGVSFTSFSTEFGLTLLLMAVLYMIANVFFAGGIMEVFTARDGIFSMRRFWAGAGTYFWRFFRLWVVSLGVYAAIFFVYLIVLAVIEVFEESASTEAPGAIQRWGATGALIVTFGIVNMIFDYARIGTVVNRSQRMFHETGKAVGFVARQWRFVGTLYLLVAILGAVLFALITLLRSSIPQSSLIAVAIAFLLGQFAIAARMWSRLVSYAAQLNFYQHVIPEVELPPVVRLTPEFAAAVSERISTPTVEES